MARPKKPVTDKVAHRLCICLKDETADLIYRYAELNGEPAGPIVRRVLENVFGMLKTPGSSNSCYGDRRQPSASTMRYVLTGSPHETGARLDDAVSSSLGHRE
jgi:hypothetical protein